MRKALPIDTCRSPPKRGANGQFTHNRKRYRQPITKATTVGAPGWLKGQTKLDLIRLVLRQELNCARFRCELGEAPPTSYERPKRVETITGATLDVVERRKAAMYAVIHRLAENRVETPPPREFAALVENELGEPFSVRALYRRPYDTIWRYPKDWFGREEIDAEPDARRLLKLTAGELIKKFEQASREAERLERECNQKALAATADW